MVRLRESGGWYIERHRGFSVSFAEEYGICSFNPGCWYADAPYSLAAARKPLAPNPAIRRRGALMIPYYHRPRAPPVAFRFRSALPDEFVKRPPHISRKIWRNVTGGEPCRYKSPRGMDASMLFNEAVLRAAEPPDQLYVCEGELDCVALLERGVAAVGLQGQSNGWDTLARFLSRLDIPEVILVPDREESTILRFKERARRLAAVATGTIEVVPPRGPDVDATVRAIA